MYHLYHVPRVPPAWTVWKHFSIKQKFIRHKAGAYASWRLSLYGTKSESAKRPKKGRFMGARGVGK